jgi:chaperonin cofactor prefoldin
MLSNYNNEYIHNLIKKHDEDLQYIHIIFNKEISELKESYNQKINNLEMKTNELETRMYRMKNELNKIKFMIGKII